MNPSDEEKLTRWIDGDLPDAEAEELLGRYPELRGEKEAAQKLAGLLKSELGKEQDIPFPDFFNHQIQRFIEEEKQSGAPHAAYGEATEKSLFPWFTFWRNLAAGAFLLLLGFFIGTAFLDTDGQEGSTVLSAYTPNPAVASKLFYSDAARATVLLLDGLQAIPASHTITGHDTANYRPGTSGMVPALYSVGKETAYVLVKDEAQIPTVYEVDLAVPPLRNAL